MGTALSTNNEQKQYEKRENTPLCRLFHPKGRDRQNHLYRAGGKLPLLPQRLRCGGGRLRLPATLHCRNAQARCRTTRGG